MSKLPVTGVINTNDVMWEFMDVDYICLDCEEMIKSSDDDDLDWIECDSSHTKIHGDWILDTKDGKYTPDEAGEFSMIENESTCQVVFSIHAKQGNPCSPCYPNQVEFSKNGQILGYILPSELLHG